MSKEFEAALMTAFLVLLTIGVYNTVFKKFTPVPVRNFIGM